MDEDFAVTCPLVRPGLPRIRFLFVRSRFGSTLLSDAASRRRPCASLALHLHQVVQGTCTPKLSNMLGTQLNRSAVGQNDFLGCRRPQRLTPFDASLNPATPPVILSPVHSPHRAPVLAPGLHSLSTLPQTTPPTQLFNPHKAKAVPPAVQFNGIVSGRPIPPGTRPDPAPARRIQLSCASYYQM
jgi:hypothetical protein